MSPRFGHIASPSFKRPADRDHQTMRRYFVSKASIIMRRILLLVCCMVFLEGFSDTPHFAAKGGLISPGRISNDISGGELVDTVPAGGEGSYSFGNWPALIISRKTLARSSCGGEFLSRQFVLTSAHCVRGVTEADVLVSRPGLYVQGGQPRVSFRVDRIFRYQPTGQSLTSDIALLKLKDPFDDLVGGVPLYHDNGAWLEGFAVAMGNSSSSGERPSKPLYRATVQLDRAPCVLDDPEDGVFNCNMYIFISPTTQPPQSYPPVGAIQKGDSGGPLGIYLDGFPVSDDSYRMVGITSKLSRLSEMSASAAAIDSDVMAWIGSYLGLIVSPVDGQLIPNTVDPIYVEVTGGSVEGADHIELMNAANQPVADCVPRLEGDRFGCSLEPAGPYADGAYRVRAYRGALHSYDEVLVHISHQQVDLDVDQLGI